MDNRKSSISSTATNSKRVISNRAQIQVTYKLQITRTDEEEDSTFSIEYIPEEDSTSVIEVDEPAEHIPAEPDDSNTDDHDVYLMNLMILVG
jgi:hypothetical protein